MLKSNKQIWAVICGVLVILLFAVIGLLLLARGFFD